jgi:signal transduction histidine kinase
MLTSMLAVAAVAIVLFAIPLGLVVGRLYKSQETTRLEREATRAVGAVPASGLSGVDPVEAPFAPHGLRLAYYDDHGRLVAGKGPANGGRAVDDALHGRVGETDGANLVVAVPIQQDEKVVGVARAAESTASLHARVYTTWAAMLGLGILALAAAAVLARRQARRLAAPINDIENLAIRLGAGDFAAHIDPHDVPELDRAADALNRTATQLGELITRERAFTADVSHQLTTPLTSLRLGLEGAVLTPGTDPRAAISEAIVEVDRLQRTVTTLLAIARDVPSQGSCDAGRCCVEVAERHFGTLAAAGRPLRVDIGDQLPLAACSADALQELIEVLVDNAERHGRGAVTLRARAVGAGVVIDVEDEGPGITRAPAEIFERRVSRANGHGIGLALARAIADAHGARLQLARPAPHPLFSIALVGAAAGPHDAGRDSLSLLG